MNPYFSVIVPVYNEEGNLKTLYKELSKTMSLLEKEWEIIFVNDATLYLQAGNLEKFLEILNTASTQIINAYYGKTFTDSALTRREKQLAEKLMKTCDEVIFIESSDSHKKFFRLNRA